MSDMDYINDPGRWSLQDLLQCLEEGEGPLQDHLGKIANLLREENNPNFILGKVIIVNDLDDIEDEEDDDGDIPGTGEDDTTTETPKE